LLFLAEWLSNVSVVVGVDAELEKGFFKHARTQATEDVIVSQSSGLFVSEAENDELRDRVDMILRPLGMHTKLQATEDVIVSQWSGLSVSESENDELRDKVDKILRPLGMHTKLLVMVHDKSIALYFVCMMLSALLSLRDQWRTGQLRDIVQSLFTFLSGAARIVHVKRLTWPVSDYERCMAFFNPLQGNPTI